MIERQVITCWYTPEEKFPEPDEIVVATISGKTEGIQFKHSFGLLIWTGERWYSPDYNFEYLIVHAWCDLEVYGGNKKWITKYHHLLKKHH